MDISFNFQFHYDILVIYVSFLYKMVFFENL